MSYLETRKDTFCGELVENDRRVKRLLHELKIMDDTTPGYWSRMSRYNDKLQRFNETKVEVWSGLCILACEYEPIVPNREETQKLNPNQIELAQEQEFTDMYREIKVHESKEPSNPVSIRIWTQTTKSII